MKKGGQDGYYLVVVRSCLLLFFVRFFFCLVGFLVGALSFRIRTFFALPALDPQSVGAFLRFLLFGLYFPSLPFSSGLWDILERFPSQVSFLYQDFGPCARAVTVTCISDRISQLHFAQTYDVFVPIHDV